MKNSGWGFILVTVVATCLIMAWVETMLLPGYGAKSLIKAGLFVGVPAAYFLVYRKPSLKQLMAMKRRAFRRVGPLALVVFVGILLGYHFFGQLIDFTQVTQALNQNLGISERNFLWVSLYIIWINSLLEEFFFRGFAFLALQSKIKKWKATLFSASAFALYHVAIMDGWFSLGNMTALICGLFLAGLFFNWLDDRFGGILPGWMIHASANLAINLIGMRLMGMI